MIIQMIKYLMAYIDDLFNHFKCDQFFDIKYTINQNERAVYTTETPEIYVSYMKRIHNIDICVTSVVRYDRKPSLIKRMIEYIKCKLQNY